MVKVVKEQNPQVCVVGISHANYIKRGVPNLHYVAFKVKPYDKTDGFVINLLGKPSNPNEVITLTHRLSREYYYQKYGIT